MYKGVLIAIKKINKEHVVLSRDDLLELKVVRQHRKHLCVHQRSIAALQSLYSFRPA